MTLANRRYDRGTLVVRLADNPDYDAEELHRMVSQLAQVSGAEVVATDTSYSEEGVSFGSRSVMALPAPRIALAWDDPTVSYSAGNTRFVLERQFGYPVEPVRVEHIASDELDRFDVLILPDGGNYAGVLGARGVERLKNWVERGGVLVAMSGGMRFAASDAVGLLPTDLELLAGGKRRMMMMKVMSWEARYWQIRRPISRRFCRKRRVRIPCPECYCGPGPRKTPG